MDDTFGSIITQVTVRSPVPRTFMVHNQLLWELRWRLISHDQQLSEPPVPGHVHLIIPPYLAHFLSIINMMN
jgi:hypothetical protein